MAIKITSDSTCDLTKELLEKHDIELFPLYITLGGKTLRDGVEITPDDIFAHVAAGGALASTAAVTPNDYETRFAQLSREYDAVIHINISSDFSACHQNARIAAENYKNVYVVDSRNLSSGHGHVVVEAALRAEAGDVLHRQLVEFLHRGHADRIEFHLLLFGGDGVQPGIVLFLDEFLGGKVGRYDFDAVLVDHNPPSGIHLR